MIQCLLEESVDQHAAATWLILCIPVAAMLLHPFVVFALLCQHYRMSAWEMLLAAMRAARSSQGHCSTDFCTHNLKKKKTKRGKRVGKGHGKKRKRPGMSW